MNIFLTSRIINTSINWRIQKLIQFSENDNLKISCLRIETLVDFYEQSWTITLVYIPKI